MRETRQMRITAVANTMLVSDVPPAYKQKVERSLPCVIYFLILGMRKSNFRVRSSP